jgi:DNA-binding FadR family transcriptional regulator
MRHTKVEKSRPRDKQFGIVCHLSNQIVSGLLQNGRQLPSQENLMGRFTANSHTVQPALGRLDHKGFIQSKRRAGAFTVDALPVTYLGFDIRAILVQCLEILRMQQRGEAPPQSTMWSRDLQQSGRHR